MSSHSKLLTDTLSVSDFSFNDLYNQMNSVNLPPNWVVVRYRAAIIFIEILDNGEERKKVIINSQLRSTIKYKNESISWITCEKIKSLDHMAGFIKTLDRLPFSC